MRGKSINEREILSIIGIAVEQVECAKYHFNDMGRKASFLAL